MDDATTELRAILKRIDQLIDDLLPALRSEVLHSIRRKRKNFKLDNLILRVPSLADRICSAKVAAAWPAKAEAEARLLRDSLEKIVHKQRCDEVARLLRGIKSRRRCDPVLAAAVAADSEIQAAFGEPTRLTSRKMLIPKTLSRTLMNRLLDLIVQNSLFDRLTRKDFTRLLMQGDEFRRFCESTSAMKPWLKKKAEPWKAEAVISETDTHTRRKIHSEVEALLKNRVTEQLARCLCRMWKTVFDWNWGGDLCVALSRVRTNELKPGVARKLERWLNEDGGKGPPGADVLGQQLGRYLSYQTLLCLKCEIDNARKRMRDSRHEERESDSIEQMSGHESVEDTLDAIGVDREVVMTLFDHLERRLTPLEFKVYNLRGRGFSNDMVAKILKISAPAASGSYRKVKAKLGEVVDEYLAFGFEAPIEARLLGDLRAASKRGDTAEASCMRKLISCVEEQQRRLKRKHGRAYRMTDDDAIEALREHAMRLQQRATEARRTSSPEAVERLEAELHIVKRYVHDLL